MLQARRILVSLKLGALAALVVAGALIAPTPGPVAASGVAVVSAGSRHTCAVTTAGGVKCWGRDGQADVSGLTSGVAAVSAGSRHSCALTTTGGVKCWGSDTWGQLGDGRAAHRHGSSRPVDVSDLTSGVAAVSAGDLHTCAVTTTGGVTCWGYNASGQFGDGSTVARPFPASPPAGLTSGAAAVSAGLNHTCAVTTTGAVKCWGQNFFGELGDGNAPDPSNAPVDVSGLTSGVAAVSAGGRHSCALTTAGGVQCWGLNVSGQLGDGSANDSATPVDVSSLTSGVAAVSAGDDHTCALTTGGGVQCWGRNISGQLGNGSANDSDTPIDVSGLSSGVAAVSAGLSHTCAVTTTGDVKCWGRNASGQLGDGSTNASSTPVDVLGLTSSGPELPDGTGTPVDVVGRTSGIAEPPDVAGTPLEAQGSSGPSVSFVGGVVAAVAAGALALGGAAWYARRRALRSKTETSTS